MIDERPNPSSSPHTRRTVLTAAVGGMAATVVSALGRPLPTRGAAGDPLVLGNVNNFSDARTGLSADIAATPGDPPPQALTVWAERGYAIFGATNFGAAVAGHSNGGYGDPPEPPFGVVGTATGTGIGVVGESKSGDGIGVHGSSGTAAGVDGESGSGPGVAGISGSGPGVEGRSGSGPGVRARGHSGPALDVVGKARFSTAGAATVPQGQNSVFVANAAVTTDSHISITLVSDPGPRQLRWVSRADGSGFTVHLAGGPPGQRPATEFTYLIVEPSA